MGVAGKNVECVTYIVNPKTHVCALFAYGAAVSGRCAFFVGPFFGPTWSVVTLAFNKKSKISPTQLADPKSRVRTPKRKSRDFRSSVGRACLHRF